jgi:CheY-like chemotaxis protein
MDEPSVAPRPRLLIVEDNPYVREFLLESVALFGYAATAVPNGEAAILAVADGPPDLVLCDVQLPGLSGVELCRLLKTAPTTQQIPILIVTAAGESARSLAAAAGADALLPKPCALADLKAAIARLLARACTGPSPWDA